MNHIAVEIGKKIRNYRKAKHLTIVQLGQMISKSKATISKYEKGDIIIDIVTLYEIASALNINVDQLLYRDTEAQSYLNPDTPLTYFNNTNRYYTYSYDGRNSSLIRGVINIYLDENSCQYKTVYYMNVKSFDAYEDCENTYVGYTEYYDALTNIMVANQATPIEKLSIKILAPFLETNSKWGLMSGVSFRPLMPIAAKILLSKDILEETEELLTSLLISKEDIRLMKIFNMFSVT